jgi:hypothetical protein
MALRVILRLAQAGDGHDREVEILVLRHQVKVLSRKAGRPKLRRRDRIFLAAASRILPSKLRLPLQRAATASWTRTSDT